MAQNFGANVDLNRQLAASTGYTGDFGGGAFQNWLKGQDSGKQSAASAVANNWSTAPGVRPTTVASQNPYQQNALYDMGQPSKPVDPRVGETIDKIGQGFDAGSYKQFMNPYIQEVINRNADNTRRQYDVSRRGVREDIAASGGFGSTALGTAYGQLGEAENRQIGDYDANLRASGFDKAMTNALGLYGTENATNLNKANAYLNLDQYERGVGNSDLTRQLYAGDRIQRQNQDVIDAYYRERDREMGYPYEQIQFLQNILGSFPTGSSQTSTAPGVGMVPGAIGGALLGNAINPYLPWNSGIQGGSSSPTIGAGGIGNDTLGVF